MGYLFSEALSATDSLLIDIYLTAYNIVRPLHGHDIVTYKREKPSF